MRLPTLLPTLLCLSSVSGIAAQEMRMATPYADSFFQTQNVREFAQNVGSMTDGAISFDIHTGSTLVSHTDIPGAVAEGELQAGEFFLSILSGDDPIFGLDSLPFVATDYGSAADLWDEQRPLVQDALRARGLVALYAVPWPPQGLYFNKEVNSVADMAGTKFRSYNSATARLAELTGMLPVTIEAAEISQAFATGVAESMISSGATGYDRKVWENLSHYYKVNAWLPRNYVMVNKQIWEGLSAETQGQVQKAADETGAACSAKSEELANWYFEQLSDNGMTVTDAGPEFLGELQEIGAKMTADWLASAGDDGQAILDAYNAN